MKIVSILLLVLMLNVSCREMKTTAVESNSVSNKNQKQQPEESARINLKLNGRNTSGLFDFVFSKENKIIGIGIGSQSGVASANKKDGFESKSKKSFLFVAPTIGAKLGTAKEEYHMKILAQYPVLPNLTKQLLSPERMALSGRKMKQSGNQSMNLKATVTVSGI